MTTKRSDEAQERHVRWINHETKGCEFADVRLAKRFGNLLGTMAHRIGQSIPAACQDWANTKAAYRFLANPRVTEEHILAGHFAASAARASTVEGVLLVLHDTCEFSYERGEACSLGLISKPSTGRQKDGSLRHHTVRGILMHSSLVVTPQGLPLGLAAIKFWTRKQFKGTNALKRKVNPTRVPIEEKESYRWLENVRQATGLLNRPDACVHIGDRESDIYELFHAADELGTRFLVRTCVERLAGEGASTTASLMHRAPVKGTYRIKSRTKEGEDYEAVLNIKYEQLQVRPPLGKQEDYPPLTLTVIHATEATAPKGRQRIEWKLLTNLPVDSLDAAIEKLKWYALRWKIETFHKILKSGCKAEESKLRASERLANLISLFCIVAWRIFWVTMLQCETNDKTPELAFTATEMRLLDRLVERKTPSSTLSDYALKLACLGGYLARASDPPPGNLVMWRGMSRLNDIQLGFCIAGENCG
jgi:hypothetical protein